MKNLPWVGEHSSNKLAWVLAAALFGAVGVSRLESQSALTYSLEESDADLVATLLSHDVISLVVKADDGNLVRFAVDESSQVPAGLVAGNRVVVGYKSDLAKGRYRVVRVRIPSAPVEPGSTTPPPPLPDVEPQRPTP